MDACLICHLQNLFDPFGVFGLGIGAALAVGSGVAWVGGGIYQSLPYWPEPLEPGDDGYHHPDEFLYHPPARWSRNLAPDPNGYTPPIDPATGQPHGGPEYRPDRPPRGWKNAYWDTKAMRWDRPHPPADLLGMRG